MFCGSCFVVARRRQPAHDRARVAFAERSFLILKSCPTSWRPQLKSCQGVLPAPHFSWPHPAHPGLTGRSRGRGRLRSKAVGGAADRGLSTYITLHYVILNGITLNGIAPPAPTRSHRKRSRTRQTSWPGFGRRSGRSRPTLPCRRCCALLSATCGGSFGSESPVLRRRGAPPSPQPLLEHPFTKRPAHLLHASLHALTMLRIPLGDVRLLVRIRVAGPSAQRYSSIAV